MAFQSVPKTVEIDVIYTLNGVIVQNVFYAEFPAGYALLDLQQLAGQIDAQVAAAWLPDQPIEAVYLRTEVRGLEFVNDFLAIDGTSTGPGTAVSEALPGNVTFAVKKSSALTGRSARGRSYWIGIPRAFLKSGNENEVTTGYAAIVVANIDLIRTSINGLPGWFAVLVSRFADKVERPFGVTFSWISSINTDERVDTQRNRLS